MTRQIVPTDVSGFCNNEFGSLNKEFPGYYDSMVLCMRPIWIAL